MQRIETVVVSGSAFYNIERAILESHGPKKQVETSGDLIGYRVNGRRLRVVNAYPWPLTKADKESVVASSSVGRKRIIERDKELRKYHLCSIVGGYHTHCFGHSEEMYFGLSDKETTSDKTKTQDDITEITKLMRMLELEEWIEIVASVRIGKYQHNRHVIDRFPRSRKKLRKRFGIHSMKLPYTVVFEAYLVDKQEKAKLIHLELERSKVRERETII